MKYIAIIAAEDKEVEAVKSIMSDISDEMIYDINISIGKIKGVPCVLAKSGVGKVNAGRTTQVILDKFETLAVINTGSAGALDERLNIGDIVISSGLVQHDFDVTAFGREKGFVSGVGKIFEADSRLIDICENALTASKIPFYKGLIATGDRFLSSKDEKLEVRDEFNAMCAEMEGGAVAHVCKLCNTPFMVIRSISDELNGDAHIDFNEFLETASKKCANIIYNIIEKF